MTPQSVIDQLGDINPDAYLFENMASALIGIGYIGHKEPVAVYSRAKIYAKLLTDGLSDEDANEYFLSKFVNTWLGDHTPVIIDDVTEA